MTRTEWLEARTRSIGSSDAPSLAGCGFRDAAAIYRDKTEPVDDRVPESGYLARGIAMEPLVAARYEQVMGVAIVSPARYTGGDLDLSGYYITRHPLREWQSASLDRRRADNGAGVELKTVAGWTDDYGENGSADVPAGYRIQVTHQMGVTGTRIVDLAALNVIDWSFRVFRIDFDEALWNWITAIESEFWHKFVLPRVPPPSGWEDAHATPEYVRQVVAGTRVELGEDAARLLDRRRELLRIRDQADEEAKTLTGQVEAMMGMAERASAGGWNLKRSFVKGGNVAYKRADAWRLTVTGRKS